MTILNSGEPMVPHVDMARLVSSEWPTVPRDGTVAPINSVLGQYFVKGLVSTRDHLLATSRGPVAVQQAIADSTERFLKSPDAPIPIGAGLMIDGTGLVVGYKDDAAVEARPVVMFGQRVFGRLCGAPTGNNLIADTETLERHIMFDGALQARFSRGPQVVLRDVQICATDPKGTVLDTFAALTVPLQSEGLQFHKAVLSADEVDYPSL